MNDKITQKNFEVAEKKMNDLLNIATQRGGFDFLTPSEISELDRVSAIVEQYENKNYDLN